MTITTTITITIIRAGEQGNAAYYEKCNTKEWCKIYNIVVSNKPMKYVRTEKRITMKT